MCECDVMVYKQIFMNICMKSFIKENKFQHKMIIINIYISTTEFINKFCLKTQYRILLF